MHFGVGLIPHSLLNVSYTKVLSKTTFLGISNLYCTQWIIFDNISVQLNKHIIELISVCKCYYNLILSFLKYSWYDYTCIFSTVCTSYRLVCAFLSIYFVDIAVAFAAVYIGTWSESEFGTLFWFVTGTEIGLIYYVISYSVLLLTE